MAENSQSSTPVPQKDSLKHFITLLRRNLILISIIFLLTLAATIFYVIKAKDIYTSTTTIKITKPQGSVLSSSLVPQFNDFITDRFIANEIEVMKSYKIREGVALNLLDSVKKSNNKADYFYIYDKTNESSPVLLSPLAFADVLPRVVTVNQKRGLDVVDIEVQSPSKIEASAIANIYAYVYLGYSLDLSKEEVTTLRKFLEEEKENRFQDLNISEAALQDFLQRNKIVLLDQQAQKLVDQISVFEAEKNASQIEIAAKEKSYSGLTNELKTIDPSLYDYLSGKVNEPYITRLQSDIADLEVKRDIDLSIATTENDKNKVSADYNKKLALLKANLEDKVNTLKTSLFAGTPEQRREIGQKLLETGIEIQSLRSKSNTLAGLLGKYEAQFDKLPSNSIELAKLERKRKSAEKLFLILEEKYQEALVNERVKINNVVIIDPGVVASKPSKPNRPLLIIFGLFLGLGLGIGCGYIREFLDKSVKNPEELENKGVTVLSWIPSVQDFKELGALKTEFFVEKMPSSIISESFKALRTRISYSKLEAEPLKTILITSTIPSEGKTTVALNLAGSFAQAGKKVLLLDCDLRKPRIHTIFSKNKFPGISDYLFANVTLEEIIRPTSTENLSFATSGTIPPNPSELLGSNQMKDFIKLVKSKYDLIIFDSPPYLSVTDAEILFRLTDGTVLVVHANKTPIEAFMKSYGKLKAMNEHNLLGAVLNNFSYKNAYGYYYNYYYNYNTKAAQTQATEKV